MKLRFQVIVGDEDVETFKRKEELLVQTENLTALILELIRANVAIPTGGLEGQVIAEPSGAVLSKL